MADGRMEVCSVKYKWRVVEEMNPYRLLYLEIAMAFNDLDRPCRFNDPLHPFRAPVNGATQNWMQVRPQYAAGCIHYEWETRVTQGKTVDVTLHFELQNLATSMSWIAVLRPYAKEIEDRTGYAVTMHQFGHLSAEVMVRIPYCGEFPDLAVAPEAARVMKLFIESTRSLVENRVVGT